MADADPRGEDAKGTSAKARTPVALAAVASIALGAAGYLAVGTGLVPGLPVASHAMGPETTVPAVAPERVFVELDPFMVSISGSDPVRQLRLELQLEIPAGAEDAVRAVTPRLEDTMNTYLRSIDLSDIENPDTLLRMRLQLLRRLQVAAGEGRIHNLLVTQFLIS